MQAGNRWEITQSFDFDNMGFGTPENGDQTPLEKDLGRTLSFFAFDPESGDFYADNAKATIKGYLERLPEKMSDAEIHRLQDYIQLGIVTSYLWRSSYLADELQGKSTDIHLARPDPGVHVTQIRLFDNWLSSNQFADIVESLQSTPQMERHRDIEREAALFRNSLTIILNLQKVHCLLTTQSLMPHMTKSIVLNNDGQNEIQMPANPDCTSLEEKN